LETAVDDLLSDKNCAADRATMRSKLTILQIAFASRADVAERAEYAWSRLSRACHHHAYELSPSVVEVGHLLQLVRHLAKLHQTAPDTARAGSDSRLAAPAPAEVGTRRSDPAAPNP